MATLPISFEPNVGQAPGRFDFVARGRGYGMAINATGASLALGSKSQDHVRMQLVGAIPSATPSAHASLPGTVNYFIGDSASKWRSDVPTYGRVMYQGILPGIDITYHGSDAGTLEYDFTIAPGTNTDDIRVRFAGADDVALKGGRLVITTAHGAVTQDAPVLFQTIGGERVRIEGGFTRAGNEVGFEVGEYDHTRPLVIDPTLVYSTYLGGASADTGFGITVDRTGAAYVTGQTGSVNFPTKAPIQGSSAGSFDAFVTKLDPTGSTLIFSTYLGGSGSDIARGIAVDGAGAVYVTGSTISTDFPTQAPFQGSNAGANDAFVTKLNDKGSALLYSTYLGGPSSGAAQGNDVGLGIAVDGTGAAYVAGYTFSTAFPTQVPFQGSSAGGADAFVTKLNPAGSALPYSTYLGGSGDDTAQGIAVDGTGAAYITGDTWPGAVAFPTQNPFQASNGGGPDAYVTKLAPSGSTLTYSTYLGGSGGDTGYGIALDSSDAAYVVGNTDSTNFPTMNPLQATNAGSGDAFVTKLNAPGSALTYSTYLGGSGGEIGYGIATDPAGSAYVTGSTASTNFPTQTPLQGTNAGSGDAFISALDSAGAFLTFSTFFGGSGGDSARGIAVDPNGAAYVTGSTTSTNFPTQMPLQASNGGAGDAFITKLTNVPAPSPSPSPSPSPVPTLCDGRAVTIQVPAANQTTTGTSGADVINGTAGNDTIKGLGGNDVICGLGGKDIVRGNDGNDVINGNGDRDFLYGDKGDDVIYGGAGNDVLYAGLGIGGQTPPDTLYGGAGHDALIGGAFGDRLEGDAGNDRLFGNGAWDKMFGGSGRDVLHGNDGKDTLSGQQGKDKLYGDAEADSLNGGAGSDTCNGGGGVDTGVLCEVSSSIP